MEKKLAKRKHPLNRENPRVLRVQVVFYLEPSMLERVDDAAYSAAVPRSEWIREAIKEKLQKSQEGRK